MEKLFTSILCIIVWVASLAPLTAQEGVKVEGELLVQLEQGYTPELFLRRFSGNRRAAAELRYGRPAGRRFNVHILLFDPERSEGEALLERVRAEPGVKAAQFNYEVSFRQTPNDPDYERQWGLARIGAPEVWDITTGGKTANDHEIVVAVLDAGFDPNHVDLRDNVWVNPGEIANDGKDNDKNGLVDDVRGWNFVDSSATHRVDQHGHSVAGIIGARGNNRAGVTGVNWSVKLMLLDIRLVDQIVAAYEYVVDQRDRYNKSGGTEGSFVVATNASFGLSKVFCKDQPIWGAMYDRLGEAGVLTGAGTANSAWDVEEIGDMPTTCTSEFLVTVLNTNETDERHQGSAYGNVSIDMGAPGQNSYTTKPSDTYGVFNGNSASAPHLTGAIALLYSLPCNAIGEAALKQPAQTARQIRDVLLRGVDPLQTLQGFTVTGGRLNVARSAELAQNLCEATNGPLEIRKISPNPSSDKITLEYETPDFEPYRLQIFNALGQEVFRNEFEPSRFAVKLETITVSQWAPGVYFLRLGRGTDGVTAPFVVYH